MTRDIFIKKIESYQTSQAPIEVKQEAIAKLKQEFFGHDDNYKHRMLLNDILISSSELKPGELF